MTDPSADAPHRCRACAAEISKDAPRCERCGTSQRVDTCPHCGAVAGASPHGELRLRCDVCGGPRVPLPQPPLKRSGREIPALQRAGRAASARTGWRAAAIAGGTLLGFNLLVLSVVLLIAGASVGVLLAGLITALPLAAFMFWAFQRAKARGREIGPALDAAWLALATDIANQSRGDLTAGSLAAALGIAEPQAEELLALLEVNDIVRGAMTAGGDMVYSSRLRIAEAAPSPAPAAADPHAFAAEEEALAAEDGAERLLQQAADAEPTKR
jgi:hypothetical protein